MEEHKRDVVVGEGYCNSLVWCHPLPLQHPPHLHLHNSAHPCSMECALRSPSPALAASRARSATPTPAVVQHHLPRTRCCRCSARSSPSTPGVAGSAAAGGSVDARGLSYLGDSIWTLCVRRHFFAPPKHWRTYQDMVQPYVTAEGQAAMYDALLSGAAGATASEQQLLAGVRAQVSHWRLRKRFNSAAAAEAYRKATAFEALIGHLHLHDPQRLVVLTEALMEPSSSSSSDDSSSSSSSSSAD